jgi:hypothetical protein
MASGDLTPGKQEQMQLRLFACDSVASLATCISRQYRRVKCYHHFQGDGVRADPHPPTQTSAASPAARARRYGRWRGREGDGVRADPHPPARTSAASQPCGPFGSVTPHPCPTRASRAPSPAARARRYGRWRGREKAALSSGLFSSAGQPGERGDGDPHSTVRRPRVDRPKINGETAGGARHAAVGTGTRDREGHRKMVGHVGGNASVGARSHKASGISRDERKTVTMSSRSSRTR